nr:ATP-binding protein [Pseudomonadota bacterium]
MQPKATKDYLAALVGSSSDAIIARDLNGIITFWNRAAETLLGYGAQEMVGQPGARLVPEDLLGADQLAMDRLGKGEAPDRFETVWCTKSGLRLRISLSLSPIRDEEGQIAGALAIAHNAAANQLAVDRQWMILEAGHVLGSSLDYEQTLSTVCKLVIPRFADWCALDLFTKDSQVQHIEVAHKDQKKVELAREFRRRYPPHVNPSSSLMTVLRTGAPQIHSEVTDDLLAKGALDSEHLEMMRRLGLKSILVVPLIARGQTLGAMTLVMSESAYRYVPDDIHCAMELASRAALAVDNARLFREAQELSRKQEEMLSRYKMMQEQLSLLVEASGSLSAAPDIGSVFAGILALSSRMIAADAYALWRYDIRNDQWSIGHASKLSDRYQQDVISGYSQAAPVPEGPVIAEDVNAVEMLEARRKLYASEGICSLMALPLRVRGISNGTLVFYYRSPHRFSELEIALGGALSNLAASAVSNAELYGELKANDAKKDEFLAMLAHELRNPLAPISNAVHILSAPSLDAALREETGNLVKRQIAQMTRILDDLLDVSRITQGKIELRRSPVLLAGVVQTAIEAARPLTLARGQTLVADLPSAPILLNGDAARLSQAFSNLLNNAAKYSGKGGAIKIGARIEDGTVVVEVADNGIGIPKDMQESIFDMFSQVDSSMERSQGGLGIGLTLVKSIVDMHGGSVEVRSDGLGKGSTFVVSLPLLSGAAAHRAKEDEKPAGDSPSGPMRLLVVDDNEASGKTLTWMLEMFGHQVEFAMDGTTALK